MPKFDASRCSKPKNPSRGLCDWQFGHGGWCTDVGRYVQGTQTFCKIHRTPEVEHKSKDPDWLTEKLRSPEVQKQPGESSQEYVTRMRATAKRLAGEVNLKLVRTNSGGDNETKRRNSLRDDLGDEAFHDDLAWED